MPSAFVSQVHDITHPVNCLRLSAPYPCSCRRRVPPRSSDRDAVNIALMAIRLEPSHVSLVLDAL